VKNLGIPIKKVLMIILCIDQLRKNESLREINTRSSSPLRIPVRLLKNYYDEEIVIDPTHGY